MSSFTTSISVILGLPMLCGSTTKIILEYIISNCVYLI